MLVLSAGCGGEKEQRGTLVPLDLEKSDEERLVRYYFGGYLGPDGGDPFEAGLTVSRGGRLFVDVDSLHRRYNSAAEALADTNADGTFGWDEVAAFLERTYYDSRRVPRNLGELSRRYAYQQAEEGWMTVDVRGPMTTALRTIYAPTEAIRAALRAYDENESRLIYPVGTAFIGEHRMDGLLLETTAMIKRGDGFWDYVTYGEDGELAPSTGTPPRPLKTPTQCVGCHFGSRLFEPEESFPRRAPDGPRGERAVYVEEELRDPEVVAFFDEHARRSDTVLGLYGTLFVSRLRAERRSGRIRPADAELLEALNL